MRPAARRLLKIARLLIFGFVAILALDSVARRRHTTDPALAFRRIEHEGTGVLFELSWPGLAPAPMSIDVATLRRAWDAVVVVSVTFHGPSYAGREAADLFLRMPSSPSDAEPLAGYDVREVAGGQDLYFARSSATWPQEILCVRKSKRPGDTRRPSCGVLDPLDTGQYPRQPDGRFPVVLSYHFARAHLVEVADIDRRLRARIDQEGIPRALAMRWHLLRCEASTIVGR